MKWGVEDMIRKRIQENLRRYLYQEVAPKVIENINNRFKRNVTQKKL